MNQLPTPLFDNIILLQDQVKEEDTGGILVPEEQKTRPKTGTVVKVGKGIQCPENGAWVIMQVKEGDRVLFGRFVGAPLVIGDKEFVIMKQSELLLIL